MKRSTIDIACRRGSTANKQPEQTHTHISFFFLNNIINFSDPAAVTVGLSRTIWRPSRIFKFAMPSLWNYEIGEGNVIKNAMLYKCWRGILLISSRSAKVSLSSGRKQWNLFNLSADAVKRFRRIALTTPELKWSSTAGNSASGSRRRRRRRKQTNKWNKQTHKWIKSSQYGTECFYGPASGYFRFPIVAWQWFYEGISSSPPQILIIP